MLKYLVGSATQGSADAFVQGTIQTGLQNVSDTAYRIRTIDFQLPVIVGADCSIYMALTRKSQTGFPTLTDHSVIQFYSRQVEMTTSGMVSVDQVVNWQYAKDVDLVIVEDPVYFQLDTTGTSASNIGIVRIGYEERRIGAVERLAIIAASLA